MVHVSGNHRTYTQVISQETHNNTPQAKMGVSQNQGQLIWTQNTGILHMRSPKSGPPTNLWKLPNQTLAGSLCLGSLGLGFGLGGLQHGCSARDDDAALLPETSDATVGVGMQDPGPDTFYFLFLSILWLSSLSF